MKEKERRRQGEEKAREGEDSEMATRGMLIGRNSEPVFEELYRAADISTEIVRLIHVLELKMAAIGRRESADLNDMLELKLGMLEFRDTIYRLAMFGRKEELHAIEGKTISEMETGWESTERSGGETQDWIIGKSGDEILEETVHRLAGVIMSKYEAKVGDIPPILEAEKTRREAGAVLSFGFEVELFGRQIDQLWCELRGIVSSFSPENKDVRKTMIMLMREPCLHGIAKLRWISEQISRLQQMDPDLDSEVKSSMMKLKSESYVSSIKEQERSSDKGVVEDKDEKTFAAYRLCWERTWGNGSGFEDQTLLSPMQFTHCTPSRFPVEAVTGRTLQIYSIKVSSKGNVWPLKVYGVVAARDSVDRQRNPLFLRTRNDCQVLTQEDPYLELTGPVRAIVSMDTVYIETELKKKGRRKSEDVALASTFINSCKGDNFSASLADNTFCTVELCFEQLEQSVQATIVSVVVKPKPDSLPFPYGGKVLCSSLPCSGDEDIAGLPSGPAVLLDSIEDGKLVRDRAGHLDLLRRVVSVELKGKLQFQIQTYVRPDSPEFDAQVLLFTPKKWNISKEACCLSDGSSVEITVAWSLLPSKMLS
ncbi:unnamed protein product [Alopecurus aequalis]